MVAGSNPVGPAYCVAVQRWGQCGVKLDGSKERNEKTVN
jgi:hypothetical protein